MSPAAALASMAERADGGRGGIPPMPESQLIVVAPNLAGRSAPVEPSRWKSTTTGVVLCGGKSSRMGADKALLVDADGLSLLERACTVLAPLAGEVLLACGPTPRYAEFGRPLVLDTRSDGGPLAGLEAALERSSTRRIAVLACDMPRASTEALLELLALAESQDLDVCSLATPAGLEPLCAIYSRDCLPAVRAALDCGQRRMVSFHAFPSNGRALRIAQLDRHLSEVVQNLNTPKDWDDFRKGAR